MKISKVIETLTAIKAKYGDIAITGGAMTDDEPLREICVIDTEGMEIWPDNPNELDLAKVKAGGVFLQ